jgi:hypothetical protein
MGVVDGVPIFFGEVSVIVPTGNQAPDGGAQVDLGGHDEAVGGVKVTMRVCTSP